MIPLSARPERAPLRPAVRAKQNGVGAGCCDTNMIRGQHLSIRTADVDDANTLHALYNQGRPFSALLDNNREHHFVTRGELRELLASPKSSQALLNVVEDPEGRTRGFCSLRAADFELRNAVWTLMYLNDADYASPMTDELYLHFLRDGFTRLGLNKIIAHCLDTETTYRESLIRHGFTTNGVQREVTYRAGRWLDMETLSIYRATAASRFTSYEK